MREHSRCVLDVTKFRRLMAPKSTGSNKSKGNKNNKEIKSILEKVNHIPFNRLAQERGFKQGREKKISGKTLVIGFLMMSLQGKNTFQNWAEHVSLITGKIVSKQAIWKKVTPLLTSFLSVVLFDALRQQIVLHHKGFKQLDLFKNYKRILIQDSTVIALPIWLSQFFPGNVSRGEIKALLKIQVVYDLLSNRFIHFEITTFRANDQSKAKDMLNLATSEDLVIRDLGYFVLNCFEQMNEKAIHFISRLRNGVNIYELKTEEKINLLKELQKGNGYDKWVLIGEKQKVKGPLVALPLTEEQASIRRRKAKENRDQRLNHTKEYYKLLSYQLFITTEVKRIMTSKQVALTYGLRWRIESIFKCWKSSFHLQKTISQTCSLTKDRVLAMMYLMLIFILLFQVAIYNQAMKALEKKKIVFISLMKLCQFITAHLNLFFEKNFRTLMPLIIYHCSYDKRHDRQNFLEKIKN